MTFKKLALASAIAMVPTVGFSAMVEIEDTALSDMTGQDGIEIDITTTSAIGGDIYIHDTSGLAPAGIGAFSFDGAIVIDNLSFNGAMNIDIDAGDSSQAGAAPTLQINVSIPTATIITGDIRVANSQRDDASPGWGINTQSAVLLNTMTIAMSGLSLNIQLGNEPQGDMIAISSTIASGLSISNFALNDAGGSVTGGSLGATNILIKDNGSANLTLGNVRANASTAGLIIDLLSVGTAGIDLRITDAYLGTTSAGIIGDVTVVGLNVNGTRVTISGKP